MGKLSLLGVLLVLALALMPLRAAESKSYGQPNELRGTTKVFIDTYGEIDLRDVMVQTLAKRLSQVTVVSDSSEAEIVLAFSYSRTSAKTDSIDGRLIAKRISGNKVHYIASYRHDEAELDDLAEEIVLRFIKQYKVVNGITK